MHIARSQDRKIATCTSTSTRIVHQHQAQNSLDGRLHRAPLVIARHRQQKSNIRGPGRGPYSNSVLERVQHMFVPEDVKKLQHTMKPTSTHLSQHCDVCESPGTSQEEHAFFFLAHSQSGRKLDQAGNEATGHGTQPPWRQCAKTKLPWLPPGK